MRIYAYTGKQLTARRKAMASSSISFCEKCLVPSLTLVNRSKISFMGLKELLLLRLALRLSSASVSRLEASLAFWFSLWPISSQTECRIYDKEGREGDRETWKVQDRWRWQAW